MKREGRDEAETSTRARSTPLVACLTDGGGQKPPHLGWLRRDWRVGSGDGDYTFSGSFAVTGSREMGQWLKRAKVGCFQGVCRWELSSRGRMGNARERGDSCTDFVSAKTDGSRSQVKDLDLEKRGGALHSRGCAPSAGCSPACVLCQMNKYFF